MTSEKKTVDFFSLVFKICVRDVKSCLNVCAFLLLSCMNHAVSDYFILCSTKRKYWFVGKGQIIQNTRNFEQDKKFLDAITKSTK